MNCIYLWQVPRCDPLGLGQEYRCLFRNVCLAQLYRGSLWVNELGSASELFMRSCLYLDFISDRNPRAWCLASADWPYSLSEKGRLSQTQRQTGHQDAKKYYPCLIQPESSSTAVAWWRTTAGRVKNKSKLEDVLLWLFPQPPPVQIQGQ